MSREHEQYLEDQMMSEGPLDDEQEAHATRLERTEWHGKAHKSPYGWTVELRTGDGALIYLHRDIARELGNLLRGAADECDVRDKEASGDIEPTK